MRGSPSDSSGDGDGWVDCACGQLHWGVFGAAGLLLRHRDRDGTTWVLLQHRAPWSHHGDTWGLPGGARMSTETPWQAAVREADEEAGVAGALVHVMTTYVVDHGPWSYTTVVADVDERFPARATGAESVEVRWVPMDEVTSLTLHPGLAAAWPELRGAGLMASSRSEAVEARAGRRPAYRRRPPGTNVTRSTGREPRTPGQPS